MVVGTIATLGYMYVAGKQTKAEEGPASLYSALLSSVIVLMLIFSQNPRDRKEVSVEWAVTKRWILGQSGRLFKGIGNPNSTFKIT